MSMNLFARYKISDGFKMKKLSFSASIIFYKQKNISQIGWCKTHQL